MNVKQTHSYIVEFVNVPSSFGTISAEFSPPWHFNFNKTQSVTFGAECGIYLFTKPAVPDWDITIESNTEDIWYVGESAGNIERRVWDHVGRIYESGSDYVECDPRFKYNQCADEPTVPEDVKRHLANGDVVVYTVKITPGHKRLLLALEKHLLSIHVRTKGQLPLLNKIIQSPLLCRCLPAVAGRPCHLQRSLSCCNLR
jgi:hypothetical protein